MSASSKELNLFALDEMYLSIDRLKKRTDLSYRETDQQGVVGYLLNARLSNDLTTQYFNKLGNPIPSGSSLSRSLSRPEFDLARHDLLAVFDPFTPIVEYSRLLKTILDSPVPYVMQLLK